MKTIILDFKIDRKFGDLIFTNKDLNKLQLKRLSDLIERSEQLYVQNDFMSLHKRDNNTYILKIHDDINMSILLTSIEQDNTDIKTIQDNYIKMIETKDNETFFKKYWLNDSEINVIRSSLNLREFDFYEDFTQAIS